MHDVSQFITEHIDTITRRWVDDLRQTPRTEVHKGMLTSEIVDGTKAMLAHLAKAIATLETPDGETVPIQLVMPVPRPTSPLSRPARPLATRPLVGALTHAQIAATEHGKLRHKQGFALHEVLFEYTKLRQAIWDTLRESAVEAEIEASFELPGYLDRIFDELLAQSVEAFVEASVRDLEKRAIRDPLTQLYNKEYFAQRLNEEMRRSLRNGQPLTVAMVDMDLLKLTNDTFGHPVGDAVIQAVSKAICETCRQSDIPCRYGGDEFVVILPETTKFHAANFAERLMSAARNLSVTVPQVAKEPKPNGAQIAEPESGPASGEGFMLVPPPTLSIGLASFPEDGRNPETLVAKADSALYIAKRAGRNRVSA